MSESETLDWETAGELRQQADDHISERIHCADDLRDRCLDAEVALLRCAQILGLPHLGRLDIHQTRELRDIVSWWMVTRDAEEKGDD